MKKVFALNSKVYLFIGLFFLVAFFLVMPVKGEELSEGEKISQYCGTPRLEEAHVRILREVLKFYDNDPARLYEAMLQAVKRQKAYVLGDEKDWRFELDDNTSTPADCNETVKRMEVTAVGDHCYVWQEVDANGDPIDPTGGATAADVQAEFDNLIYDTDKYHFGDEPNVDGDDKIHILFLSLDGPKNLMGYFWGYNEWPKTDPWHINSNEAECIIVDSDESRNDVFQTIAHEFQHMIHWKGDGEFLFDEDSWVNEGCSKMAEYFCYGSKDWYDQQAHLSAFQNQPEQSLTLWTYSNHDYGQVYAFFFYLWEKINEFFGLGDLAIYLIVQEDDNGVAGINNVLGLVGIDMNLVHKYWAIACYLDDTSQLFGLGGYTHDINQNWGGGPVDGHIQLKFAADGDNYYYGTTITDYPKEASCIDDPWGVGYYEFQASPAIFDPNDPLMLKQMDVLFDGSSGSPAPVVVKKNTAGGTVAVEDMPLNTNQEGHNFTDDFGDIYDRVALLVINPNNTDTSYTYRGITEPKPISPANDTQIVGGEGSLPPTFEWDSMGNNRYYIQFSTDPNFYTINYSSDILQDSQWTVPDDVWGLVNQVLQTQDELTLYWRVLGGFMNAADQLVSDVHISPIFKLKIVSPLILTFDAAGVQGETSVKLNGTAIGNLLLNNDVPGYLTNTFEFSSELLKEGVNEIYIRAPYSYYSDIYDDIQLTNFLLKAANGEIIFEDGGTYHIGDNTIAEIWELYEEGNWMDPNPPGFWTELIGSSLTLTFEYPATSTKAQAKGGIVKRFYYSPGAQCQ